MKNKFTLLLMLLFFAFNAIGQEDEKKGYLPGDEAGDFNLLGVDGQWHSLSSYEKVKGFVVVFTCNTCPFAQAYESRIIAIHKKYASKGIPVIAINPNDANREPGESLEKMIEISKANKYPFPYLVDADQSVANIYGAKRTPHIFLLNAQRKVMYIGAIDDNFEEPKEVKEKYLENAIKALLSGKPIQPKQTKAIGCGIKWKK